MLKKEEKNEDDETRFQFTVSMFVTLVTISSNLLATVRWSKAREQI